MVSQRWVIFQSFFFAILGVLFLYLSFHKTNFSELVEVFQMGRYWVVLPVLFVSIMVYWARVKRWQILYKATEINAPQDFLFASLASGYLVNFAVPRLGEITRALVLKRYLNYPVNTSLSTIVFERIADVLCLVIILLMAFLFEFITDGSILQQFTNGVNWLSSYKIAFLLAVVAIAYLLYRWLKSRQDKVSKWFTELIENLFKLTRMKGFDKFLFYTFIIWLGFFLMTYLWFFMFQESEKLSLYQAYMVMVLGVVARTLPIQAGSAGAYHYVVSKALIFLGISINVSNALAIIIHGFQTILTILFGLIAYIWLLRKKGLET